MQALLLLLALTAAALVDRQLPIAPADANAAHMSTIKKKQLSDHIIIVSITKAAAAQRSFDGITSSLSLIQGETNYYSIYCLTSCVAEVCRHLGEIRGRFRPSSSSFDVFLAVRRLSLSLCFRPSSNISSSPLSDMCRDILHITSYPLPSWHNWECIFLSCYVLLHSILGNSGTRPHTLSHSSHSSFSTAPPPNLGCRNAAAAPLSSDDSHAELKAAAVAAADDSSESEDEQESEFSGARSLIAA